MYPKSCCDIPFRGGRERQVPPDPSFAQPSPGGYDEGGIPDPYHQVGDAADETSKLYFALYVLTFFVLPCG